jgi:hypothetical protein
MVWKKVRLGKRVRKNGSLFLGMRPEGLSYLGVENGTLRREEMHLFMACFEGQREKMRLEGLSCLGVENGKLPYASTRFEET